MERKQLEDMGDIVEEPVRAHGPLLKGGRRKKRKGSLDPLRKQKRASTQLTSNYQVGYESAGSNDANINAQMAYFLNGS